MTNTNLPLPSLSPTLWLLGLRARLQQVRLSLSLTGHARWRFTFIKTYLKADISCLYLLLSNTDVNIVLMIVLMVLTVVIYDYTDGNRDRG